MSDGVIFRFGGTRGSNDRTDTSILERHPMVIKSNGDLSFRSELVLIVPDSRKRTQPAGKREASQRKAAPSSSTKEKKANQISGSFEKGGADPKASQTAANPKAPQADAASAPPDSPSAIASPQSPPSAPPAPSDVEKQNPARPSTSVADPDSTVGGQTSQQSFVASASLLFALFALSSCFYVHRQLTKKLGELRKKAADVSGEVDRHLQLINSLSKRVSQLASQDDLVRVEGVVMAFQHELRELRNPAPSLPSTVARGDSVLPDVRLVSPPQPDPVALQRTAELMNVEIDDLRIIRRSTALTTMAFAERYERDPSVALLRLNPDRLFENSELRLWTDVFDFPSNSATAATYTTTQPAVMAYRNGEFGEVKKKGRVERLS